MVSSLLEHRTTQAVQRRTMTVLMIAQIIGAIGVGVGPSLGVLLAGDVTHNEAFAGVARTATTLGAAMFGLWLGTLAAQRGRRVALGLGWWLAAAGSALLVAAAQWNLVVPLFLGLLIIGAGSATVLQARFAATDLAEPHHKARSLALVVWVGTLGSVLGPNLGAPGEYMASTTGLTVFAAAFLIAAICLTLAGLIVVVFLRPDPLLLLERAAHVPVGGPASGQPNRIRQAINELQVNGQARVATVAILTAQAVMVGIMTMTPVHIVHQGGSITTVGITISLHVAGMYALAPVVGLITDRLGYRFTISAGIAIFLLSLVIGAARPDGMSWIMASLVLLGVGWSFVNIAGSALFSVVVSPVTRAASQGGVDALSNLCGAAAAFIAGPLLVVTSFSFLSLLAIVALVPLAILMATRSLLPDPPALLGQASQ